MKALTLSLLVLASACGGDDGGSQPDASSGTVALTVRNVLSWCSVTVNNGTASTSSTITTQVAPGAIPLKASAVQGFKIDANMWHLTDGDTGAGETGTVANGASSVTATVAAGTPKCVWVCCPFPDGSGCNVANPCP